MKLPFWNSLTLRKRKVVRWSLGLLLAYAVIGFLILPPIIRRVAVKQLSSQLGREVSIEKIKINPFALSTTVRGLLIKDPDGGALLSWDEFYVNFELSSLVTRAWTFKEIHLLQPHARMQVNWDYTFNFSDLIAKFSSTNAPAKTTAPAKPLVLRVSKLHIGGATASYADLTTKEPFKRAVGPLDITMEDFRTDHDNKNPHAFTGTTDAGERITWSGFFYLNPLRSEGELTLDNFTVNKYVLLYQNFFRFEVRSGSGGVHLNYQFELSESNRITAVNNFAVALRDFKIGVPGETNNLAELEHFAISGAVADLEKRTASVDLISAVGANLFIQRDKDASVNVLEAAKPAASATNTAGGIIFLLRSVTNAVTLLLQSTNQWSGIVHQVDITNCSLHLEDLVNSRPAKLDLTGIRFMAKNISNLPGTNLNAELSLNWNTNGSIHTIVSASFLPPTADVIVDLNRLDLGSLDAYLEPSLNLYILGSQIGLHGDIRLRTPTNELPQVTFQGSASLDNFHTVDGTFAEDLVKWDSLRANGIEANLNPPSVTIDEIVLENAYARMVIETNQTINLLNALQPASAPVTNGTPAVAIKNPAATNAPLTPVSIGAFIITNMLVNFTDHSMSPEVNLSLREVNGRIAGLSTAQLQHADVNLAGKVDGVGPVAITGKINPLNDTAKNEIKISVKNVDLTSASSYAGKFAGYKIARGKLNLDLNYELTGKKLSSKNVITLDRFTFGEKVASSDATKLPVRLAVALLKDREGKIVLDVPIEGRTDDPKFRIGKVVLGVLQNILVKVATSPFSLLGAAFGGGEEMAYQDFAPGSTTLTEEGKSKLDLLAKALYERPSLELEIGGSIDREADLDGLQRAAIDKEIRQRLWQKLRQAEQATNSVDQLAIPPEDREHWVQKLFAAAHSDGKITEQLLAANTNLAAFTAQILPRTAPDTHGATLLSPPVVSASEESVRAYQTKLVPPPSPQEAVLLTTFMVGENDFQTLAAARAKAVQSYLLQTGQVEAGRLFLTTTVRTDGSRAFLLFQ